MTTKLILAGPRGKMGIAAIEMINETEEYELVAVIDRINNEKSRAEILANTKDKLKIFTNEKECFQNTKADVFIDLTKAEPGFKHTKAALENDLPSIVGTSGFTETQIKILKDIAEKQKIACIIAPNFAIGAVLMMQFSKIAARYFKDVEIIEKHHDRKLDAPSGTAVKTAQLIQEVRDEKQQGHPDEKETIQGARGADFDGMRIHSMRLPGLVAHQEVVFGSPGQLLTVKHDSFDRHSFMEGVKLSIEEINKYDTLIYGLEHLLNI